MEQRGGGLQGKHFNPYINSPVPLPLPSVSPFSIYLTLLANVNNPKSLGGMNKICPELASSEMISIKSVTESLSGS